MKKQIWCAAISCVLLLAGCGNEKPLDSSVSESSVESTTSSSSSVESSSESSSTSGGQNSSSSEVADNQDVLKSNQSSQSDSNTSTDVSTSEPTSSSSGDNTSTSKPTSETSKPTSSSSSNSKPATSSSSSQTGGNTSPYWNPDAEGNTPGKYGGYYDANGVLHCQKANVPKDADGYSVISYTDEYGVGHMTKAEKEAARAEEERLWQGGVPNLSDEEKQEFENIWTF